MKTFDQTTFTDRAAGTFGDCTRACVYTLAQVDMDLPHPVASETEWNQDFFDALEEAGYYLNYQPVYPGKDYSFLPRICAVGGPTVRTDDTGSTHMVVYDMVKGEFFHDPHPSRDGLTRIDGFYWLATE